MSEQPKQPGTPSNPDLAQYSPHKNLGVAGGMAKAFIHSPLSPLFLFACLAMGLMGLLLTPRQEDPQISVPMVDIFVRYPGAVSQQVATLVTDPLERIMSEIHGVKHVYSASMRGEAMVTVEFDVGENLEDSIVKLRDKIMSNMDKVPPGVETPLIKPMAVDDVPMVTLTLWSHDLNDSELRVLSLDVLQRLKEVENTSKGFVVGGRAEQLRVDVMPERLSGFKISMDQIAQTIKTANSVQGVGDVESGDVGRKVYTGKWLQNAQDLRRLVLSTHQGVPVYLGDVAKVESAPEETSQMVAYYSGPAYRDNTPQANGAPAVTIAIAKKMGSNGVSVANDLLDKVEELKGRLIPSNVYVAVTRNYGETANEKVNELLFKLCIATLAVTVLVWFFLGLRPAVVTLIVIPVVILMTVFAAWIMGYTIDRVSLFALIFSIGILVDDAIVVVENIYRRWLLEDNCCHIISVDAVREVGNPTILATFTVIAALLPMGFVRGMMGPYMEPIPALGSVAMLFSLFAAFIFTPWLTQLIKPSLRSLHIHSEKEHAQAERMERFYRWIIPQLIHSKAKGFGFLFGMVFIFFLCMVMFYTQSVAVKIMPLDNKPEFNVVVNMSEGTAMPKTANLVQQLTNELRNKIPEIIALQTYVATASPFNFNGMVRHYYLRREPWQGDIQVQLVHKSERERTSHELAILARHILTPIARQAGARIEVVEMPPGPPVLQSVVAEVTGPTAQIRHQVAQQMTRFFEDAHNIVDEDNYIQEPFEVWRFEVDTEKAVRRGVSVDAINRNLGMAMGGARLGDIKRGRVLEPTYIVIQVPLNVRAQITSLAELPVMSTTGTTIPLGELGRFVREPQDPIIFHKDLRPVEFVTGEVEGVLDAPIYGMMEVEKMLENYTTPDGVKMSGYYMGPPETTTRSGFEWTGEWTVTYETFRDMGMAFGVALILIYMLVVWEFGNFVLPAIIMAPIPLTLMGIIPGHWLLDAKFTATSMIGFIALAGIIVRNSILLVDFSQQEVLKGVPLMDAVIMSCKARTRPILITALALVAGSSVILSDFIFMGMAISLLFGVLISTLLTLLVIPLGCISAKNAFRYPTRQEAEEMGYPVAPGVLAAPAMPRDNACSDSACAAPEIEEASPPAPAAQSAELPPAQSVEPSPAQSVESVTQPEPPAGSALPEAPQTAPPQAEVRQPDSDPGQATPPEPPAAPATALELLEAVHQAIEPAPVLETAQPDSRTETASLDQDEETRDDLPEQITSEAPAGGDKGSGKAVAPRRGIRLKPPSGKGPS
ncbi:MAG: efflux RND transporter permease subunit [Magnetococcales bacterium]|nr:efflux RND transporter permease subunit [Magnetococcales bacterium]